MKPPSSGSPGSSGPSANTGTAWPCAGALALLRNGEADASRSRVRSASESTASSQILPHLVEPLHDSVGTVAPSAIIVLTESLRVGARIGKRDFGSWHRCVRMLPPSPADTAAFEPCALSSRAVNSSTDVGDRQSRLKNMILVVTKGFHRIEFRSAVCRQEPEKHPCAGSGDHGKCHPFHRSPYRYGRPDFRGCPRQAEP